MCVRCLPCLQALVPAQCTVATQPSLLTQVVRDVAQMGLHHCRV